MNAALLSAFEAVPRALFLDASVSNVPPLPDRPVPIGCGQIQTAATLVARILDKVDIQPGMRVLEIGTGSGYQTSVIAQLGAKVFTIEWFEELQQAAQTRFATLRLNTIRSVCGNGAKGWTETDDASFDVILINNTVDQVPEALIDQLAAGGLCAYPQADESGLSPLLLRQYSGDVETVPLKHNHFLPLIT